MTDNSVYTNTMYLYRINFKNNSLSKYTVQFFLPLECVTIMSYYLR